MNIKKQLFFAVLTLSSATLFCADEFKEKVSVANNTKSSSKKIRNKDATVAFMLSTILPLAQEGKETRIENGTLWDSSDALDHQYLFFTDKNKEYAVIGFSEKPAVDKQSPSPLKVYMKDQHYELMATEYGIALRIKLETITIRKHYFDKEWPKITLENAKACPFLKERYLKCVELYPNSKKPENEK